MEFLAKHLAFVNDQFSFHAKMAERYVLDPKRAERHLATAQQFKDLAGAIETAMLVGPVKSPNPVSSAKKPAKLYLGFDEIEGLPDEVIQELSISEGDRTDYAILRAIEDCGGVASIDRILLSLYKKTEELIKRPTLTSRLYRLVQKSQLYNVEGRKGVYALRELTPEEIGQLE